MAVTPRSINPSDLMAVEFRDGVRRMDKAVSENRNKSCDE